MAFAGQEIADCMNAGGREKRLQALGLQGAGRSLTRGDAGRGLGGGLLRHMRQPGAPVTGGMAAPEGGLLLEHQQLQALRHIAAAGLSIGSGRAIPRRHAFEHQVCIACGADFDAGAQLPAQPVRQGLVVDIGFWRQGFAGQGRARIAAQGHMQHAIAPGLLQHRACSLDVAELRQGGPEHASAGGSGRQRGTDNRQAPPGLHRPTHGIPARCASASGAFRARPAHS